MSLLFNLLTISLNVDQHVVCHILLSLCVVNVSL